MAKKDDVKQVAVEVLKKPTRVPPDTVECGGFKIEKNDVTYHPHAGETVTIHRGIGVAEINAYQSLLNLREVIVQSKGDKDAAQQTIGALHTSTDELRNALADRIVEWTWTDYKGRPMPKPADNPDAFLKCTIAELVWLTALAEGETDDERKNDSSG